MVSVWALDDATVEAVLAWAQGLAVEGAMGLLRELLSVEELRGHRSGFGILVIYCLTEFYLFQFEAFDRPWRQ